jgi:mono/diheme cytochrome c family protein
MIQTALVLAAWLAAPAQAADHAELFRARCAGCHGSDGKGRTAVGALLKAPDLTATRLDAEGIAKVVKDGRGRMKAMGGRLSEADASALADYVKALREAPDSVDDGGVLKEP